MLRLTIICLVLMVLVTIVIGEEPADFSPADIIVPTEKTAELPADFLPADFIEEVTSQSPLPEQNKTQSPVTFSVNDLPRTSGMPEKSSINAQDTGFVPTEAPTPSDTEKMVDTILEEAPALPTATAPTFLPQNAIAQETLSFSNMTPSNYGLLDRTNGGFADNIWSGLTEEQAQNLITPLTEAKQPNPWAQNKLSTLLLTRAAAPEGSTNTSWLAFRAQKLLDMGQSSAAFNLLKDVTPDQRASDADLMHVWTMTHLLAGQSTAVCPSIENEVRNNSTMFWKKGLLLCQALQGESQKLALSLNVTTPEEKQDAPLFYSALASIAAGTSMTLGAPSDTVFIEDAHMATLLARQVETVPSRLNLTTPFTSILQQWRDDVRAPFAARLMAAENLAKRAPNNPNVATLKSLYLSVQFSPQDVTAPLETAKAQAHPTLGRALLYQAVQNAPLPTLKANTLAALFKDFKASQLDALSPFFVPEQTVLTPMTELAWLAPDMVRYGLLSGNTALARNWLKALEQNDNLSADLTAERHTLALAVAVAERQSITEPVTLWIANTPKISVQPILASLDALGLSIPAEVWRDAAANSTMETSIASQVGPLWLRMVADGLQNSRSAHVLLLLLQPVHDKQIQDIAPLTLANMITGFGYLEQNALSMDLVMQLLLQETPKENIMPAMEDIFDIEPAEEAINTQAIQS